MEITEVRKIDLHMHTKVSDGTDTPAEIIPNVISAGLELFSVTDHDAIRACGEVKTLLKDMDPKPFFISGIEFSCKDNLGKYHILGYGYDAEAEAMQTIVSEGHARRIEKAWMRLDYIKENFNIEFPEEDIEWLFSNSNPGKPHIAKLLIKHGYAESIKDAFDRYLNRIRIPSVYTLPEEAINAILLSGGIPVLAHPSYGSGDELIISQEMDERLQRLVCFGLQGVEAYYSGFTDKLQSEMLHFADEYDLYVTAGSDYHGSNKLVRLGDTNLRDVQEGSARIKRFLENVPLR